MKHANKKFGAVVVASLLGLILLHPATVRADTSVAGSTFSVTATVTGVNALTTQAKNISDNANAGSIAFGTIGSRPSAWSNLAQQYIQINVDSNAGGWELRNFTNNFVTVSSVPTTVWGYSYGGLVGNNGGTIGNPAGAKTPMAWRNNPTVLSTGPTTGSPAAGINGWTFYKDLRDQDDPTTVSDAVVNGFGNKDESFAAADAQGYSNIAFGGPAFTRIVKPNAPGASVALTNVNDAWFYYMEADFNSSAAASYSSPNLVLELLNL